jgi:septum formation protein
MSMWRHLDRPLILASVSPRRRDILTRMGLAFEVVSPSAVDEERFLDSRRLEESLRDLALAKAQSVASIRTDCLVLGADTVVLSGSRVMGKPLGYAEARRMLLELSGRRHEVLSGVALVCGQCGFTASAIERTGVIFRELGMDEIEEYLLTGEYADKAGAYAIQGRAMVFVKSIEGCYYNVVGLPASKTIELFTEYAAGRGSDDG